MRAGSPSGSLFPPCNFFVFNYGHFASLTLFLSLSQFFLASSSFCPLLYDVVQWPNERSSISTSSVPRVYYGVVSVMDDISEADYIHQRTINLTAAARSRTEGDSVIMEGKCAHTLIWLAFYCLMVANSVDVQWPNETKLYTAKSPEYLGQLHKRWAASDVSCSE